MIAATLGLLRKQSLPVLFRPPRGPVVQRQRLYVPRAVPVRHAQHARVARRRHPQAGAVLVHDAGGGAAAGHVDASLWEFRHEFRRLR